MDQGKRATSLSTTRLSPLAKPFTLNRSVHTPSSSSSLLSPQLPSVRSLDQCNDDPFSSLLDSFRKSNMGSKVEAVPVETALTVETSAHKRDKSVLEQKPSAEFGKNGDFNWVKWSHFENFERSSVPTYSSSIDGLGYGSGINVGVGSSADGNVLQDGNHAVDGLNPSKALSDDIKNSTGTIGGNDILSNLKGTINKADESSSFILPNNKVAHLKFSTDASNAKKIPQNQSSKNTGGDTDLDPDVDSPCWKGTIAFNPPPSDISWSAQIHHVEKATDKHNSLNPLAPQFFPGIGYIKDDLVSSSSSAPVSSNLLLGEDLLMNTVVAESPLELNKGIELQHSTNICGGGKAFNMLTDPKSCSVEPLLNSHSMMTQSSSKVDCSTANGKMVTVVDVDGFVKGTKDKRASESKNGVFPTNGYSPAPTSSSYGVDVVTNLFETLKGFSTSLIESPKPDVHVMVSTMHVLSELLVQTCLERVDSYNEPDSEMILQIINNLNVFSAQKFEQRIPVLDSTHADSRFCLGRSSSELPKGLEVTSTETLSVPNQLYSYGDYYMGRNSVSKVFAQSRRHISLASSSHQGTEKGDEFTQLQVIKRNLGKKLDFEKQMHPEAAVFWNLWLDSEAERCYRKFKTVHCLMEAGIDVNSTNFAELLR